jgi:hypothetical protein
MDNITVVLAPFPLAEPAMVAGEDDALVEAGFTSDAGQEPKEHV